MGTNTATATDTETDTDTVTDTDTDTDTNTDTDINIDTNTDSEQDHFYSLNSLTETRSVDQCSVTFTGLSKKIVSCHSPDIDFLIFASTSAINPELQSSVFLCLMYLNGKGFIEP